MRPFPYYLLFLFTFHSLQLWAQTSVIETKVLLDKKSGTVENILQEMGQKSGVMFSYSNEEVDGSKIIHLQGDEQTIGDYLETLFGVSHFNFIIKDTKIILKKKPCILPAATLLLVGLSKMSPLGKL